jgi:YidC/Oxa1 family membrane protein insertase
MDKNTLIGFALIAAIFLGFYVINQPSEKELALYKHQKDSVAAAKIIEVNKIAMAKSALPDTSQSHKVLNDSTISTQVKEQYGAFAARVQGNEKSYFIENNLLKIELSSKGGKVNAVTLKKYKTSAGQPVVLFDKDSSDFGFVFNAQNRRIATDKLYYTVVGTPTASNIVLRLAVADNKFIDYQYSLSPDSYIVGYNVKITGMQDILSGNNSQLMLNWKINALKQEKTLTAERMATTIYYNSNEGVDYLSETSDDDKKVTEEIKWVALKQQYFTSVLIADKAFKGTDLKTTTDKGSLKYVRQLEAHLNLPYSEKNEEVYAMRFYFGPNHYQTLKKFDIDLEKQVPLGWGIFGWVNKFLVIPLFNFLSGFNLNYGIIILALTLIIKLCLLPLTYKAYLSQAKMKILKPEIDEINASKDAADPLKKQQATMALYKKAGVNPLGGCIPLLLQMPILIALFRFFPSSIELRQQSFLWAKDLSTYDSVFDFGFTIPFYGDHVSLFTLLMTVSTILYTRANNQLTGGGNAQMAQMKWIMYLMPIIFLGVFNNYSAGLTYYYFLANMITFGQQFLFKQLVNEDEIHKKIQENKQKPSSGKSKFQQRLEDMSKQRNLKK